MKEKEEWKDVVGYEGLYLVSNFGRIKSMHTGKIMKDRCRGDKTPYRAVCLSKEGERKKKIIHSLVAEAFLKKEEGKVEVDHIDRDPSNNHVSNLRWVSKSENCQNRDNVKLAHNFDGKRGNKAIIRIDPISSEEKFFNSIQEGVTSLNPRDEKDRHTKAVNISACLHGKQKICCGYMWKEQNK